MCGNICLLIIINKYGVCDEYYRDVEKKEGAIREKYHVRKIGMFGSFARNEEKEESDVDILVEFESDFETFDNYIELKYFLQEVFDKDVDLVTVDALRPQLKDDILREVVYQKGIQTILEKEK